MASSSLITDYLCLSKGIVGDFSSAISAASLSSLTDSISDTKDHKASTKKMMQQEKQLTPSPKQIAISKNSLRSKSLKRFLLALGGTLALVLAFLGIFLPGLPCTPFALLSAALFAKSSDRLYQMLLNNRLLGPRIRNYQRRRGISRAGKYKILAFMWAMVLLSSFVFISYLPLRILVLTAGFVGSFVILFVVPNASSEALEQSLLQASNLQERSDYAQVDSRS